MILELAGMEELPDEGILVEIKMLGRRIRPKKKRKLDREISNKT